MDLMKLREEDPERFIALAFSHPPGKYRVRGFKLFNDHNAAALKAISERPAIRMIVLRRTNLLASFSSAADGENSAGKIDFHRTDFHLYRTRIERRFAQIDEMLEGRPNVMRIESADVGQPDVQAQLIGFLGGRRDVKFKTKLQTQNASRVIDRFANPANVAGYLKKHEKPEWAERG
jgi:hypothetical protein